MQPADGPGQRPLLVVDRDDDVDARHRRGRGRGNEGGRGGRSWLHVDGGEGGHAPSIGVASGSALGPGWEDAGIPGAHDARPAATSAAERPAQS